VSTRRIYWTVALCAIVTYLGSLANHYAWDDTPIIVNNALVHSWSGLWKSFTAPYWPPSWGGLVYRPVLLATFVLDWKVGGTVFPHAINILWHAGTCVLVAMLVRRWAGDAGALVAGVLFAVHPVHVEAVANIVGRGELMAGAFSLLAVYAAIARNNPWWCAVAWILGLLCKENAAVAPVWVATAWALGFDRPARRRMFVFAGVWAATALVYGAIRTTVLLPYPQHFDLAPVFALQSSLSVRLTGVSALADVLRLLVFPLTLRADYSPEERPIVTSPLDWRFGVGLIALVCWVMLLVILWRRGNRLSVMGMLWIALAYGPVANILFPVGVLVAERTLYLPSIGLALVVAPWAAQLEGRRLWGVVAAIALLGGVRSAIRVPVWKDDRSVMRSILNDSPMSYRGPMGAGIIYLEIRKPAAAFIEFRKAMAIYPRDGRLYLLAAHAAFDLGRPGLADSLLEPVRKACDQCEHFYQSEADMARQIGDSAVADSLEAWDRRRAAALPPKH
jgi:hypothetical protein